jgi:hypothetical protein
MKSQVSIIVGWMKNILANMIGRKELVFACCIGILGWDMLHRGDFGKGYRKEKRNPSETHPARVSINTLPVYW